MAGWACWDCAPNLPTFPPADPPEQVLLKLQPTWVTVGNAFTIECSVPAVAPLENLTLTLLRGQEPLHMHTFVGATAAPQAARITHNSTAHKEDGRHNFSCRAELDLRPRGGVLIRRTSEPQVLEIHGEEEAPRLPRRGGGGRAARSHSLGKSEP